MMVAVAKMAKCWSIIKPFKMPRRRRQNQRGEIARQPDRRRINPNEVIERATFNILARNLPHEFIECVSTLRTALTRRGDACGNQHVTTYKDEQNPVVRLDIQASDEDGQIWFETSLLIHKPNCYAYAFVADAHWMSCTDSEFEVAGALNLDYTSNYGGYKAEFVGPASILSCLRRLQSNDKKRWRQSFLHLVFVFIESARFKDVFSFVAGSLHEGQDHIYTYEKEVDGVTAKIPTYWKKLSTSMLDYFTPLGGCRSEWDLSHDIATRLNWPTIDKKEMKPDEIQRQVQIQVRRCMDCIFIVKKRGI